MIDRLLPFVPQRAQQTKKPREELEPFDLGVGPVLDRRFDRFVFAEEAGNERTEGSKYNQGSDPIESLVREYHRELEIKKLNGRYPVY